MPPPQRVHPGRDWSSCSRAASTAARRPPHRGRRRRGRRVLHHDPHAVAASTDRRGPRRSSTATARGATSSPRPADAEARRRGYSTSGQLDQRRPQADGVVLGGDPGGDVVGDEIDPVLLATRVTAQVMVMVPATAGRPTSKSTACTTRSSGTTSTKRASTTSVPAPTLPGRPWRRRRSARGGQPGRRSKRSNRPVIPPRQPRGQRRGSVSAARTRSGGAITTRLPGPDGLPLRQRLSRPWPICPACRPRLELGHRREADPGWEVQRAGLGGTVLTSAQARRCPDRDPTSNER